MSVRRRFRVAELELEPAQLVTLDPDVRRHLATIRATVGDRVFLFDGGGHEFEAEITEIGTLSATARLIAVVAEHAESPLQCCLLQAIPSRWKRMETIVRQTTELGVQRIIPLLAARGEHAKVKPEALARRVERWRKIAIAATEQSRRTVVPQIAVPCTVAEIDWDDVPRPLLVAEPSAEPFCGATPGDGAAPHGVSVMIGPEGGWSAAERAAAAAAGAQAITLGPRVLRADTAGVVALSLLQSRWGDLPG